MEIVKISAAFKVFMQRPEVKGACEPKVYRGTIALVKDLWELSTKTKARTTDLDDFYSKAPANIKLFRLVGVNEVIRSFKVSYSDFQEPAKKLDIYNKILYMATVFELLKFWSVVAKDSPAVDTVGVSGAVFKRVHLVQDLMDQSIDRVKVKNPDRSSILYIEMGLKRILAMGVSTDDWTV